MDTNLVLPVGHDKCEVVFDYYLEDEKLQSMTSEQREQYISSSLEDSKQVIIIKNYKLRRLGRENNIFCHFLKKANT